jgi:hypothetical protein
VRIITTNAEWHQERADTNLKAQVALVGSSPRISKFDRRSGKASQAFADCQVLRGPGFLPHGLASSVVGQNN